MFGTPDGPLRALAVPRICSFTAQKVLVFHGAQQCSKSGFSACFSAGTILRGVVMVFLPKKVVFSWKKKHRLKQVFIDQKPIKHHLHRVLTVYRTQVHFDQTSSHVSEVAQTLSSRADTDEYALIFPDKRHVS